MGQSTKLPASFLAWPGATWGVHSIMGGMLRDPRARTLSWTVLRVPLRAPDPVKASSFHAGVNAAAGNPHADMMKRFYPDTAAGGTDLEAILKSTPTRQQSHNPQTGVRIGEASHPGPICFPLDMARPGRRCRNIWCQVPLASQGPLECASIVQCLAAVPSLRLSSCSLRTMRLPGDRPTRARRSEKGCHLSAGRPLQ